MGAEYQTSQAKSVYAVIGQNHAPKRPFDEMASVGRTLTPCSFNDAILKKYNEYYNRDEEVWTEHCEIGRQVANLRDNKRLMVRNRISGQVQFVKKDGILADNKTQSGIFQFYLVKLLAEWLSSRPRVDAVCPSDQDQVEELIADVNIVTDSYSRNFFTVEYETDECISAQDFGTYVTRYRYDPEIKDLVCELLDFPACRWDIRRTAENSSYFIYESKCSTSKLEHLLNCDIPADGDDAGHYTLQLVDMIAKQGGNTEGYGKNRPYGTSQNVENETIVTEMWLQPEAYCDIKLDNDEPTLSGKSLKKGTSLLEMFPDGMCVIGLNGMKNIFAVYRENHKDHIVAGIYHKQSFCGIGKGVSDAIDPKKDMDNYRSQMMAYISSTATPATFYDKNFITEAYAKKIGQPRAVIPVDFTMAPDGSHSIDQLVQRLDPSNPSQSIFEMGSLLQNDLQLSMGVTDFSNGLPGVDNKTATGAKIGDANSEMLLVPTHLNKASHRERSFKVIYNLFRKYMEAGKWFTFNSKNSITAGKYIESAKFADVDIEFEIVANSEVPNTPLQDQMALSQVMQFAGGLAGLIEASQINPDITGDVLDIYGVKMSIPKKSDIARICRRRIEKCKEILAEELKNVELMESIGMPLDTTNLAIAVVSKMGQQGEYISPAELYAPQKAQWMAELLDSDELQYESKELRWVVEELINQQIRTATFGHAEREQDQNLGAVISMLPQVLGEQAMSQQAQQITQTYEAQQAAAQQQAAVQDQQMQAQTQLQQKQQEADISETQATAQHQRAEALQTSGHKQNMQVRALDALAKIEAEKHKAKAQSQVKKKAA